jgi:hypothetical protein
MENQRQQPHACSCASCRDFPGGETAQDHRAVNRVVASLDERRRRLFAGLLAQQRGHGGVALVARITGLSRTTIHRGMLEWQRPDEGADRIRRPGGGRPRAEKKPRPC